MTSEPVRCRLAEKGLNVSNHHLSIILRNPFYFGLTDLKNPPSVRVVMDKRALPRIFGTRTPAGKYYVSILTETGETEKPKPPVREETAVGIDLGLKTFAVRSDGTELENPRYLKHSIKRLRVLHRRISRKEKGSNNRAKALHYDSFAALGSCKVLNLG